MLFQTTRNVLFELGASAKVGELLAREGVGRRVLLVADEGIKSAGLLDKAIAGIEALGGSVSLFTGVSPDPSEQNVVDAAAQAVADGADSVVGLGGGSPMDVAKLASFLATNQGASLSDIYGVGLCEVSEGFKRRLPLIQVPTTAGTGSEVTPISIVTTGAASKMGVVSPQLLPDWAVLDGNLTLTVPQMTTAHTGVDAMVHAIEAFTCKTRKNVLSDMFAKEALRNLSANIHDAVFKGTEAAEARAGMLLGSMYAGMAFANAPVAAVHALAYPIGSHFKIPHGLSCSLMLPPVLEYNAPECAPLYAELAPIIFPDILADASGQLTDEELTALFIARIRELVVELGIPTQLSDPAIGISASDVPLLASESMKQVRLLPNNPRAVLEEDAVRIYETIL